MRFSPDKKPRRPSRPRPAEILDLGVAERDIFTFDPEIDIPPSAWADFEEQMELAVAHWMSSSGGIVITMVACNYVVAPVRTEKYRKVLPQQVAQEMIRNLSTIDANYAIHLGTLTKYSWLFPEQKKKIMDLNPSVFQQMKSALLHKEKIDVKDKQRALQYLKQLTGDWRANNHLREMTSIMLFLTNYFPDGNRQVRWVLNEAGITPENLVENISIWKNKNFRYGIVEELALCFPETRKLLQQDSALMAELASVVRGGSEAAGSPVNYPDALLAFDVLTAESVDFDHTGISIRRGPKKLVTSKPIPPRPNI